MEHWWKDTGGRKPKKSGQHMSQCQDVHNLIQTSLGSNQGLSTLFSVLQQVRTLFQSEFPTECDLVLRLSNSSIPSFS